MKDATVRFENPGIILVLVALASAGSVAGGDLDGDGYADLAVGVPFEMVSGQAFAGAVNAIYGGSTGLSVAGHQFFHQDSDGIGGEAEDGDRFGLALAVAQGAAHHRGHHAGCPRAGPNGVPQHFLEQLLLDVLAVCRLVHGCLCRLVRQRWLLAPRPRHQQPGTLRSRVALLPERPFRRA